MLLVWYVGGAAYGKMCLLLIYAQRSASCLSCFLVWVKKEDAPTFLYEVAARPVRSLPACYYTVSCPTLHLIVHWMISR